MLKISKIQYSAWHSGKIRWHPPSVRVLSWVDVLPRVPPQCAMWQGWKKYGEMTLLGKCRWGMKPKKVESTAFSNRDERRFGSYMYNSQAGGTCRSGFSFSVTGPGGNTFNNHNHYVTDCCFVVIDNVCGWIFLLFLIFSIILI